MKITKDYLRQVIRESLEEVSSQQLEQEEVKSMTSSQAFGAIEGALTGIEKQIMQLKSINDERISNIVEMLEFSAGQIKKALRAPRL